MKFNDTKETIINDIRLMHPELPIVLEQLKGIPQKTRQVAEYQAAVLYALAKAYNKRGARILEIGTFIGYSAAALAEGAPKAKIITLNPAAHEVEQAQANLIPYKNVTVIQAHSWEYLAENPDAKFDLIFVDGDHKRIRADLPFWDKLNAGGLMIFHDYSPPGTYRACPPVFEALNEFKQMLERDFDVLVVDDGGVGMAGFYKHDSTPLADAHRDWVMMIGSLQEYTIHTPARLKALYNIAQTVREVPGGIVDAGAGNGGIGYLLAKALPDRPILLVDTFQGMPAPTAKDGDKAAWKYGKNKDSWGVFGTEKISTLFKDVPKVSIIERDLDGISFTLPIAVLHVDADFYGGTKAALVGAYDHVSPGGLVIVAAYDHWQGSKAAVDEFLKGRNIEFQTLDGPCIFWKKPHGNTD